MVGISRENGETENGTVMLIRNLYLSDQNPGIFILASSFVHLFGFLSRLIKLKAKR